MLNIESSPDFLFRFGFVLVAIAVGFFIIIFMNESVNVSCLCDICDIHQLGLFTFTLDDDICLL